MASSQNAIAVGIETVAATHSRTLAGSLLPARQRNRSAAPAAAKASQTAQDRIAAAQSGDEQAFAGLVEEHRSPATLLARSILKTEEAAADAVQDALIKVHKAMPRYKEGNFRAWLLRIVANTCYDHLRSQKRFQATSLDQLMEDSDLEAADTRVDLDPERCALRRENLARLGGMVDRLPSWYRDVVVLVDMHGYDYGEAAAYLGLPRGTVKSRLSRARANLRDQLMDVCVA